MSALESRTRWLRSGGPLSTVALELPLCLAIMGWMVAVGTNAATVFMERVRVADGVWFARNTGIAAMEYRAMNGAWPTSNEQANVGGQRNGLPKNTWAITVRAAGAIDVEYVDRGLEADGGIVTVRAWQGPSPDSPVAWRCAGSQALGLAPMGEDRTTLPVERLPSNCRRLR